MSNIIFYNPNTYDIELDELGVTVPANGTVDATYIRSSVISAATETRGYVANGVLGIVKDDQSNSMVNWSIAEALLIIDHSVNSTQVGLNKATHPGIIPDRFYSALTDQSQATSTTITQNHLYATPVAFMASDFNRIGIEVTAPLANAAIRLGIYDNLNGVPNNLILDAGYVATDTIGKKEIAITFESPLDWYWLCALPSANTTCYTINSAGLPSNITGSIDSLEGDYANSAYGPLPSTFPSLSASFENPPAVWLRKV